MFFYVWIRKILGHWWKPIVCLKIFLANIWMHFQICGKNKLLGSNGIHNIVYCKCFLVKGNSALKKILKIYQSVVQFCSLFQVKISLIFYEVRSIYLISFWSVAGISQRIGTFLPKSLQIFRVSLEYNHIWA